MYPKQSVPATGSLLSRDPGYPAYKYAKRTDYSLPNSNAPRASFIHTHQYSKRNVVEEDNDIENDDSGPDTRLTYTHMDPMESASEAIQYATQQEDDATSSQHQVLQKIRAITRSNIGAYHPAISERM